LDTDAGMESRALDFSDVIFPHEIMVTDQLIDISTLNDAHRRLYFDLFRKIIEAYQQAQKPRLIVGLAGPTGSGKSVIAAILNLIATQVPIGMRFETVGIDAFHYPNAVLLSRMVGEQTLKNFKGRFDTYDVAKLLSALDDFSMGRRASFPRYSRKTHDPVEDAIVVGEPSALVVLEGLWLLREEGNWAQVARHLDFSIFVYADKEKVRDGVLKRHVAGGRTIEEASAYYEAVDSKNFDLVMQTRNRASMEIPPYYQL
jgi:pantothenate kinase